MASASDEFRILEIYLTKFGKQPDQKQPPSACCSPTWLGVSPASSRPRVSPASTLNVRARWGMVW